jgi:hypothetical protein
MGFRAADGPLTLSRSAVMRRFPTRRSVRVTSSLLVAVLAAAGCGDSSTGPEGDLTATAAVVPTTFRPGDAVTVTVTVTNAGARTRSVLADPCDDPFTVTAADGTVLPPAPRVCSLEVRVPREVAPGASVAITRDWRGDIGTTSGGALGATIGPGTYALRGVVRVADASAVVTSPPVAIQVVAR